MKNLIIDSRLRNIEYEYLSKLFNVIKLPLSNDVYEEISGHCDIFYCKINNQVICAPNSLIIEPSFKTGSSIVGKNYPNDIKYNICQIGDKIIGSKYTDKSIIPNLIVNQGYTKCSIAVLNSRACITTDKNISQILNDNNIDSLYINESNIKLLKKDKTISKMKGFIGGATLVFEDKFILFGDIERLESKNEILKHIGKYNLKLVDFKNLDVYDYGGGVIY